ncbi:MAG: hypothetical protein CMM44_07400 [Rhodospirillaceae bacterium]|nr:hypothetical protein [Rhodospirillaceae bacterium]
MNILITGGAGYLGSILTPVLLRSGYNVRVLDNFLFSQNSLASSCAHPNFEVVRGDARDNRTMMDLLKSTDVIIPLAALVGAPMCDRDQVGAKTTNLDAIVMMTNLLSLDQRILMPVTNSGYGIGDQDSLCTEETPLRPISLYGKTKVEAEMAVLACENAISFRLATVFGMAPRMRLDLLVNDFVYRAVNDRSVVLFESHFKRNFIHIRDVANVFLHGLENFSAMKNQAYNVGLSKANLTKLELCKKIKKLLPNFTYLEADIGEDPDKRNYIVSNAKIEATGYMAERDLDVGIKELIKGYQMIQNSRYGNV